MDSRFLTYNSAILFAQFCRNQLNRVLRIAGFKEDNLTKLSHFRLQSNGPPLTPQLAARLPDLPDCLKLDSLSQCHSPQVPVPSPTTILIRTTEKDVGNSKLTYALNICQYAVCPLNSLRCA